MRKLFLLLIVLFVFGFAKAQWKSTYGPYMASNYIGMDVEQLVVSGNNICAVINNQAYLSYTNGASWMLASRDLNYVGAIAYSDSTIYAASGSWGMFVSTNNGSSYRAINNNLPSNSYVDELLLSGNVLLASVNSYNSPYIDDVYYSLDKGNTWTVTNGLSYKYVKCFATDGVNFYAGTGSGVFKSTDNGQNWTNIGLVNKTISCIAVKDNRIFASENTTAGGLYSTSDNGLTWTKLNIGPTSPGINAVATGDNYVYAGASWEGIFRSSDNGSSWTKTNNGYTYSMDIETIAVKGNNVYSGSTDGCAVSTNNGTSWYCGPRTYDLSIKSIVTSGINVVAATSYMMYTSASSGSSWQTFQVSMNTLATNDSLIYAGGDGGMTISRDYGNHWKWMDIYGLPSSPKFTSIVTNDSVTFAATFGKGIYYSADKGHTWKARNIGLADLDINTLTLEDTILYAGSNGNGIFKSNDSGLHWQDVNNGIPDTCILSMASYNNIIYAGTKNYGIYKSVNHGADWISVSGAIPGTEVQCLYTCGVNVLAGIKGEGFYLSPDNGNTWFAHNSGLMSYNIKTMFENGSLFYVGTDGAGIWKRYVTELPLTLSVKKMKIKERIICAGNSSTIHVEVVGGKPPYNYSWDNGSQTASILVNPLTTTTYHLIVTDSQSNQLSAEATITVKPKPAKPVITRHGDTLISSAGEGNVWLINNQVIYNAHSDSLITHQAGVYSVYVIQNGCNSDTSNLITLGIKDQTAIETVTICPNPASDYICIETQANGKEILIQLVNVKGQVIFKQYLNENKTRVDISSLIRGVYYLKLTGNLLNEVKKIIKN